ATAARPTEPAGRTRPCRAPLRAGWTRNARSALYSSRFGHEAARRDSRHRHTREATYREAQPSFRRLADSADAGPVAEPGGAEHALGARDRPRWRVRDLAARRGHGTRAIGDERRHLPAGRAGGGRVPRP